MLVRNTPERGLTVIGFLNKTQVGQVLEGLHVGRIENSTQRVGQDKVAFLHDNRNTAFDAVLLTLLEGRLSQLLSRIVSILKTWFQCLPATKTSIAVRISTWASASWTTYGSGAGITAPGTTTTRTWAACADRSIIASYSTRVGGT